MFIGYKISRAGTLVYNIDIIDITLIKYTRASLLIVFDTLYNYNKFKNRLLINNISIYQTPKSIKHKKPIKVNLNIDSNDVVDIDAIENKD